MITFDEANSLLATFAKHHQLEGLQLDDNNSASVEFGEEHAILFEYSEKIQSLVLWAPLTNLEVAESATEERQLLRYLLSLAFPTDNLGGAYVTLNEDGIALLARPLLIHSSEPETIIPLCEEFALQVMRLIEALKDRAWAESIDGGGLNLAPVTSQESLTSIRI